MTHSPTANSQDVCDLCQQLDGLFDKVDEGIPMEEYLEDDSKMEEPQQTQAASGMDVAYAITKMRNQVVASLESQQEQTSQRLHSMDRHLDCMNQHLESLNQVLDSMKQDWVFIKEDQISMKQDQISIKNQLQSMRDNLKFLATAISEKVRQSLPSLDNEKQTNAMKKRPAIRYAEKTIADLKQMVENLK